MGMGFARSEIGGSVLKAKYRSEMEQDPNLVTPAEVADHCQLLPTSEEPVLAVGTGRHSSQLICWGAKSCS